MLSLILAASIGQCSTGYVRTSYVRSYAPTVTYGAVQQYAAPAAYAAPAYDPAAVVGEYLRNEFAQAEALRARTEVTSRLDRLETLFKSQSQYQPPVQQQQQFQAPYQQPQPQFQASPQSPPQIFQAPAPPPKSPPTKSPPNPSAQFPTGYADPPPFSSQSQAPPSPGTGTGSAGGNAQAAVTSIIQTRCASCHAAPATKAAGLALLNADGTLAPMSPALMLAIQEDVKTGKMPKGGPQVSDDELSAISAWVGDHAAEITAFLAGGLGTQR